MSAERRQLRREIRLIQGESVWLQKALFALRKAEEAREKLADARGEEAEEYLLDAEGGRLRLEVLEEALEERAGELLKRVREMRKTLQ